MKQTGHITCLFCTSICWCVKFNGIGKLIGFNWTGLATLHHWGCVCVIVQSHSLDTEKKLRKMGVILSNNTNVHRAHIWGKFMGKLAFIFSHTNIIFTITKPYKLSYIYHWLLGFPKIFYLGVSIKTKTRWRQKHCDFCPRRKWCQVVFFPIENIPLAIFSLRILFGDDTKAVKVRVKSSI